MQHTIAAEVVVVVVVCGGRRPFRVSAVRNAPRLSADARASRSASLQRGRREPRQHPIPLRRFPSHRPPSVKDGPARSSQRRRAGCRDEAESLIRKKKKKPVVVETKRVYWVQKLIFLEMARRLRIMTSTFQSCDLLILELITSFFLPLPCMSDHRVLKPNRLTLSHVWM